MDNREAGLTELYERLRESRDALGLKSFIRTPTKPVVESQMPSVVMSEGSDIVTTHSQRYPHGFPARRVLEVAFEVITRSDADIKALHRAVRLVLFCERGSSKINPIIAEDTFINEKFTEGPIGYGLPNIVGMRLILDLIYTDKGFD
jgi:hypothetical protein